MTDYTRYTDNILPGTMKDLSVAAHKNSLQKGFWDEYFTLKDTNPIPVLLSKLALITSEVGEAVEAVRKGDIVDLGEELADIVIRCFDLAVGLHINIESEVVSKMEYNKTRPHMHGRLA